MRAAMVASQLRPNAVTNAAVIKAFETVDREKFVPADRRRVAYVDVPVALTQTRAMNAPLVTARLLNEAAIKGGERVLLIGAATGYCAALLASLSADVIAVEEDDALFDTLGANIADLPTMKAVKAPLTEGAGEQDSFDILIIDGAVEQIPDALKLSLKEGGMAVSGLIDQGVTRLYAGYRVGNSLPMQPFLDIDVVHLPGFAPPPAFRF